MGIGTFNSRLSIRPPKAFSLGVLRHRNAAMASPASRSRPKPSSFAVPSRVLAQQHEHSRVHRWTIIHSRLRRAVSHRVAGFPEQVTPTLVTCQPQGWHFPLLAQTRFFRNPLSYSRWPPCARLVNIPPPVSYQAMDIDTDDGVLLVADKKPRLSAALEVCQAADDDGSGLTASPSAELIPLMKIVDDVVHSLRWDAHVLQLSDPFPATPRPRRSLLRSRYRPYPAHRPSPTKRRRVGIPPGRKDTRPPPPVAAHEPEPELAPAQLWREPAGEDLDNEDDNGAGTPEVSLEPRLGGWELSNLTGGMRILSLYPSPPIVVRPIVRIWPVTELGKNWSLHRGVEIQIVQGPLERPDGWPVYIDEWVPPTSVPATGGEEHATPTSSLPQSPPQPVVQDQVPIQQPVPAKPPPKTSSHARSRRRDKENREHPQKYPEAAIEKPESRQRSRRGGKDDRKPLEENPGAAVERKVPQERGRRVRVR